MNLLDSKELNKPLLNSTNFICEGGSHQDAPDRSKKIEKVSAAIESI